MALLQISEPGQAPAPHQRKIGLGIDLGTTHTLAATMVNSLVTVLKDEQGHELLPSVVHYGVEETLVGQAAQAFESSDPHNTLASIKRLMGRSKAGFLADNPKTTFQFEENDKAVPTLGTNAGPKTAVEVSADILKAVAERAQSRFDEGIEGVVITVPAYFDDAQRQATKDAATLADLRVLRLLNEPTAAAIAYGLDQKDDATIAVYDLGGGTFDITLLKMTKGVFEVLATGGDSSLGGDDVDHAIADWLINEAKLASLSPSAFVEILLAAKQAKEALAEMDVVNITASALNNPVNFTAEQLAQIAAPLIERSLKACKGALHDSGLTKDVINAVVMVGGSTRLKAVRTAVSDFFGQDVLTSINPDTVVAQGAAIQADILVGNKSGTDMLLLDVIPLSLGLETMGGLVEKVIDRNTTIPVARAQEFTTSKDGQTAMSIHVLQGERDLVDDCRSLARFELKGIPAMAAGAAHIRVTFQVDADGLLSVSAKELGTGVESAIQVKPSYGLTDDEIADMLKASFENAGIDRDARMLKEQQVDGERLLHALEEAIKVDGDTLLSSEERQGIDQEMQALQALIQGTDTDAIKAKIDAVSHVSEDFAARRMDAAIKQALAGHSLDEFTDEENNS